jgi:hypothetical protein
LLIEVVEDKQLKSLLFSDGFLINVDFPTRDVKLHNVKCKYCNPDSPAGAKPSSKKPNDTGEFWYSDSREEANSKATEIATKRGYNYSVCAQFFITLH